jgi:uncharacterized NAD(P)/FAD-binding protein YdhS
MTAQPPQGDAKTVVVVGGGFAGTLFALKIAAARPDFRVLLIERQPHHGRGLAYGACAPYHLLNVPVSRMELGLNPGFADWLRAKHASALQDALAESGGDLASAYVPRELFGDYLQESVAQARSPDPAQGFTLLRGNAVRALDAPAHGVQLEDGREVKADFVVLALGNLPPRPPPVKDDWFYDTPAFVPDPWVNGAFDGLDRDAPLVLLGTGQTMADIALQLEAGGHRGPIHAVSRHGLLPLTHEAGGAWQPFLAPLLPAGPRQLMRVIRAEAAKAKARGIPWQRVIDAVRPYIPTVWHAWSERERRLFLRHIRARWDVHRSRMAPRVSKQLHAMIARGQLVVSAGRIRLYRQTPAGIEIVLSHNGAERVLAAGGVINCTGPRGDLGRIAIPLIADLRRRGALVPDALGLGLETDDCAVRDSAGRASTWLYALGPLTRPAWWEITAVPEIAVQVDRLVAELAAARRPHKTERPALAEAFVDLGAGI